MSYTHSSSFLPLSWCCPHLATSQGPRVAAFSVVVEVLRLVTSTWALLAGRDLMLAASFSLQDPLGIFFMVFTFANKLSHWLLHCWFATHMISKFADLSCVLYKLVPCSVLHENVVLSNSRSVFLMENNIWLVCSCGVSSGKPMPHLLSSYSCTSPHCILCYHPRSVFSPWDIIYIGCLFFCTEQ